MMNLLSYAERWEEKLAWYAANGILPGLQPDGTVIPEPGSRGGPNGVLMWTDDAGGVDKPAWTTLAEAIIGAPAPAIRRAAKKAAAKRP
jgi:hypothetical protein